MDHQVTTKYLDTLHSNDINTLHCIVLAQVQWSLQSCCLHLMKITKFMRKMPSSVTWRHFPHAFLRRISLQEDKYLYWAINRRITERFYMTFNTLTQKIIVEHIISIETTNKNAIFIATRHLYISLPTEGCENPMLYFWAWQMHLDQYHTNLWGKHLVSVSIPNIIRNLVNAYVKASWTTNWDRPRHEFHASRDLKPEAVHINKTWEHKHNVQICVSLRSCTPWVCSVLLDGILGVLDESRERRFGSWKPLQTVHMP